ncbi:DNA-binding protein [Microvirga terricola]|uniref:DNA-binding protein n=1 Tax=Microvirga terricola TaxID=2719797 RepID=A0ABX0VBY2_9HYPH|nr:DNA-binding protein [Microvirga terricola]NIX77357.1 DNA-binding protein [Microvirga terricola]
MVAHVLSYVQLPERDLKQIGLRPKADKLEIQLRVGKDKDVQLPPQAMKLVTVLLDHLLRGERVAVLVDEPELSPNDIAPILGISRPLVVHRMDIGDLPFKYVGKHRRVKLKDVLSLKEKLDAQQRALKVLAEDTEELMRSHNL